MDNAQEMLRRAAECEENSKSKGDGKPSPVPQLVLHKEAGCEFTDITLDDFEMINYTPMTPQLRFELGI